MHKYLLTGSSGFLGHYISDSLKAKGVNIVTLDQACYNGAVKIDISMCFKIDSDVIPDVVIHAAGKAHSLPKTAEQEKVFYDVNYQGTKNLCSAIDELSGKPKAFIFISTVSVYGLEQGESINELHPLMGNSPYAKSKILAEEFLIEWAKENQIVLGILRLPLIAGPKPPGNLGAMINGIKTGRYLSIGKANARKSMVWIDDIAHIIPKVAEVGGIYNLTDGHHPSFKELESVISEKLGRKSLLVIPQLVATLLGKVGDVLGNRAPINSLKLKKLTSTLTFDDSKAKSILGWAPSVVLEKLRQYL